MKIIEVAREQRDLLNEGIAYIALWQQTTPNGKRSWCTEDFFPIDSSDEEPVFDSEQTLRLAGITKADSDAVLLNGYYHAWIGSAEEPLSAADIAIGLKRHYEERSALVSTYIAEETDLVCEDTKTDGMVGREKQGLGLEPALEPELGLEPGLEHTYPVSIEEGSIAAEDITVVGIQAKDAPEDDVQADGIQADRLQADGVQEAGMKTNSMQISNIPETITFEVPLGNAKPDILRALLYSRATLITSALGEDGTGELPIEVEDDTARFHWLRLGTDSEVVQAWSAFLSAAVKYSETAKRVNAKDKPITNQHTLSAHLWLSSA